MLHIDRDGRKRDSCKASLARTSNRHRPKEDIQNYLTRLGFNRWNNGQYMKASDAVVELWQREIILR